MLRFDLSLKHTDGGVSEFRTLRENGNQLLQELVEWRFIVEVNEYFIIDIEIDIKQETEKTST